MSESRPTVGSKGSQLRGKEMNMDSSYFSRSLIIREYFGEERFFNRGKQGTTMHANKKHHKQGGKFKMQE